jgi:hypothetical protein
MKNYWLNGPGRRWKRIQLISSYGTYIIMKDEYATETPAEPYWPEFKFGPNTDKYTNAPNTEVGDEKLLDRKEG